MDIGTLATAFIASRDADLQLAAAARLLRMNAQTAVSVVKLVDAAQANAKQLANVATTQASNHAINPPTPVCATRWEPRSECFGEVHGNRSWLP
jgi:hypothetical protein